MIRHSTTTIYRRGIQLLESNTASNSVGAVLNALAGWIELDQFQAGAVSKVDQMLRKSLDMDNSLILSQMLRVEMLKSSGDNNRAADALSRIAITYPNYIPAFLEKLWLFIACDQWGMLADASRALDQSLMFYAEIGKIAITKIPVPQRHLDSLLATALNLICKEGGAGMPAVTYLEMIAAHLRQWEPRNTLLWLKVIWVFINICYRPSAE
jgi:hypothetical protein